MQKISLLALFKILKKHEIQFIVRPFTKSKELNMVEFRWIIGGKEVSDYFIYDLDCGYILRFESCDLERIIKNASDSCNLKKYSKYSWI